MKKYLALAAIALSFSAMAQEQFSEQDIMIFHNTVLMGDYSAFERYLEKGMNIDQRRGTFDSSPLLAAANVGKWEAVKYLLKKGANPNLENALGETAISLAKKRNNEEIVKILIKAGAKK